MPDADIDKRLAAEARIDQPVRIGRLANRTSWMKGVRLAIGPFRSQVLLMSALAILAGIADTALLYVVARLALLLTDSEVETAEFGLGPFGSYELDLEGMVALAGVLLLIVLALNVPIARLTAWLCRATLLRSRRRMLHAYLNSSWTHRSSHAEGHLQEFMMNYGNRNEGVILQISVVILMGFSILIIAMAAIALAKLVALLGLVGLAAMSIVLKPVAKRVKAASTGYAQLNRKFASRVAQTARVAPEIVTFDVAGAVAEARAEEAKHTGDEVRRLRFLTKATPILFQYGALAVIIGVIWVLSRYELGDLELIGPLVLLLVRALSSAKQLQTATQAIIQTSPYVEMLEEEIIELGEHPMPDGTTPLSSFDTMVLRNVSYAYVDSVDVFSAVDLTIEPGDAIGVIGPSGGGKSTLSQLLVRLRPPTAGTITVSGIDLSDVTADSWSQVMAMVPQDNSLVRGTVADNIRFFRPHLSMEDIERAARAAHLHDELSALPEGYETDIGPGARQLSGGQRQRLGIARALIGRPQLLVLDEPTSALDRHSEELIRQTLQELKGSTTLIVVAHRPATLEVCDRILRVENGAVREVPVDSPFAKIPDDDQVSDPAFGQPLPEPTH